MVFLTNRKKLDNQQAKEKVVFYHSNLDNLIQLDVENLIELRLTYTIPEVLHGIFILKNITEHKESQKEEHKTKRRTQIQNTK